MKVKDKFNQVYDIEIMEENSKWKEYIINKINELWMNVDTSLVKDLLTTKYSPDGIPTTFIVKSGKELVGFCSLLRTDVEFRSDIFPWFGNCFVEEKYRRKGIMDAMQNHICSYAKEKGFRKIYLWTVYKDLYIKAGWQYLEDVTVSANKTAHLFYKNI